MPVFLMIHELARLHQWFMAPPPPDLTTICISLHVVRHWAQREVAATPVAEVPTQKSSGWEV